MDECACVAAFALYCVIFFKKKTVSAQLSGPTPQPLHGNLQVVDDVAWRVRENIPGGVIGKWVTHAHSRLPRHLWTGMSVAVNCSGSGSHIFTWAGVDFARAWSTALLRALAELP